MIGIGPLRGCHQGKSFAVLGSSPTIDLYGGEEEVSIAVNGAVLCNAVHDVDYFLCGDKKSHLRRWFEPSYACSERRIVATFVAPYDRVVVPDPQERRRLARVFERDLRHRLARSGNIDLVPQGLEPAPGQTVFRYGDLGDEEISPSQDRLLRGATIAGVAAQMALIMGAREIHLYGCSFGAPPGQGHYGYQGRREPGGITAEQVARMDLVLTEIGRHGVPTFSHGWTALEYPTRAAVDSGPAPEQ